MSWKLRDGRGYFDNDLGSLSIRLGDNKPRLELSAASSGSKHILLAAEFGPVDRPGPNASAELLRHDLGESYVRQDDLIASFPERAPCRFGYQMDLKIIQVPQCLGIETWLSVQTSLLDSYPQINVALHSLNPNLAEFKLISDGVWMTSCGCSALMIHPLDLIDSNVSLTASKLEMQIFGRFMEKGVIRRMRFRLFVAPQACSTTFWLDRMLEFSESPLPLTT